MALQSQSLASGELPTSNGTLLSVGQEATEIHSIVLVNKNATPVTINLFLKRPSDSNRHFLPKDLSLPGNAAYYFDSVTIFTSKGDLVVGAASATLVDYILCGLRDT